MSWSSVSGSDDDGAGGSSANGRQKTSQRLGRSSEANTEELAKAMTAMADTDATLHSPAMLKKKNAARCCSQRLVSTARAKPRKSPC